MTIHTVGVDQRSCGEQGHVGGAKHSLEVVCRQWGTEQDEKDGQNRGCDEEGDGEREESGLRKRVSN